MLPLSSPSIPSVPITTVRPTYAAIDSQALSYNLQVVRKHVGPQCRILAVVKADGYGHGAITSARAFLKAGAWGLAVSLVEEGLELRQAGLIAPIVVLGGVHPGSADMIVQKSLTPVVWERNHLDLLAAAVQRHRHSPLAVHIKVDTGMSRLGVLPHQLSEVADWFLQPKQSLRLEGVMTHLACADELDDHVSEGQVQQFQAALQVLAARGLHPQIRHVCNSAGVVRLANAYFDMVRPGISLYGGASSPFVKIANLRMAMSMHSRILNIRVLPAGTKVSYGHLQTLTRPSRLAIVPVGYADGYPRRMSGQAQVLIQGRRCPVVGNITMDVLMVDVTELPDAVEGTEVTLLGEQEAARIDVDELAAWAGQIPYEILCGISKRVPRC